jgi:hypothetical protein
VKQKLGAVVFDLPRYLWAMRPSGTDSPTGAPWVYYCNRNERLLPGAGREGAACDWQWTSDLHLQRVFPALGRSLMRRALRDWPIVLRATREPAGPDVDLTFIVGHRGTSRLQHLILTLQSIAAQQDVSLECVVVEQSAEPEIEAALPAWVRYVHEPSSPPGKPYCRSSAFNVGARASRGSVLVFHDNDMLVPCRYASELLRRHRGGSEVVNLKRFIFYLNESHSERIFARQTLLLDEPPAAVVQNLEAGGSVSVVRDAYFAIGGFDEAFVGWGGEDNEFWERAETRGAWAYCYMPIVHLWHQAQPGKFDQKAPTTEVSVARSAIPVTRRIEELREANFRGDRARSWPPRGTNEPS